MFLGVNKGKKSFLSFIIMVHVRILYSVEILRYILQFMCQILGGYLAEANTAGEATYLENITAINEATGWGNFHSIA